MSKLKIVREALETNPDIVIANIDIRIHLPNPVGYFCHTIDYWVAPKKGLYEVDDLQAFMMGLIPRGLEPTSIDYFHQYDKKSDLVFGKLYFDESVGEQRTITKRILTLYDEELFDSEGFVDGKRVIDEDKIEEYKRRIWVYPFPSKTFVRDVLSKKLEFGNFRATPKELEEYKPGTPDLLQRLIGQR